MLIPALSISSRILMYLLWLILKKPPCAQYLRHPEACFVERLISNAYEKIDILTDILLSKEVSDWVKTKYNQKITCDSSSQIDLR
ncbi:MAG: hypothetical protein IJ194_03390, partial [Bacilli bacterium]|nr:hypothetical protein [Bacilli bacterium]